MMYKFVKFVHLEGMRFKCVVHGIQVWFRSAYLKALFSYLFLSCPLELLNFRDRRTTALCTKVTEYYRTVILTINLICTNFLYKLNIMLEHKNPTQLYIANLIF